MTKKDNILFISLGRSPAVVPETIDALMDKGIYVKRTYLITTSDEIIIQKCIPLIQEDFEAKYREKGMHLCPWQAILSSDDIYTERDNLKLMIKVSGIFKKEVGNNIYISMAGGRKTMSAAMALLAQIYGARAITHVLVPPEIEKNGNIFQLEGLPKDVREQILHPKEKRLIFFPVIGISWMLDDMIKALQGIQVKSIRKEVREIMMENNLLDENYKPTPLGEQLFKLLNDIEKYPIPSSKLPELKFKQDEFPHAPKGFQKFINKLSNVPYIEEIIGLEYKNSPETRINELYSDGSFKCQYSDGDKAYSLKVITTAKSRGELQFIKENLQQYFED
ncbi:MAG: hypothetical protein BAJALOKI3v1_640027 [Promethearchaeota archaeon]|nr:MAG: hypothetical protein BAJALOKI3v1_640027 [Candidatus Lokiarchaeota archaeon]